MSRTIEAIVEKDGSLRLLEKVELRAGDRLVVNLHWGDADADEMALLASRCSAKIGIVRRKMKHVSVSEQVVGLHLLSPSLWPCMRSASFRPALPETGSTLLSGVRRLRFSERTSREWFRRWEPPL